MMTSELFSRILRLFLKKNCAYRFLLSLPFRITVAESPRKSFYASGCLFVYVSLDKR